MLAGTYLATFAIDRKRASAIGARTPATLSCAVDRSLPTIACMRTHRSAAETFVRIALCLFALGAGALAGRYSDIARHDRTRIAPGAHNLRASVRYTGSPSSAARASRLLRAP